MKRPVHERLPFLLNEWAMIKLDIHHHPGRYRLWLKIANFKARLFHPGVHFRVHTWPSELIAQTQRVWAKRLGREIPEKEAIEIIRSFRNLFSLLKEIKANAK